MTAPRLDRDFRYPRGGNEDTCPHSPALHVVYDLEHDGYRVKFRCRCGKLETEGQRVYPRYADAEAAGKMVEEEKDG